MDKVSTRRQRFMGSVDENITKPIGNAMKEVKKVGLSLRPTQSRGNVLTKQNTTKNVEKQPEHVVLKKPKVQPPLTGAKELPKVASIATYTAPSNSSSFVPAHVFDDEQKYLLYLERCRAVPALFLEKKAVTGKMRAVLFDWVLQVQERFGLAHDTLHLAWIMIDRCLCVNEIKKDKLQLLGATCMFLATKYEEVSIPHINDFIYLAASAFSKRDITHMERTVFQTINFNMGFSYPVHFLRRYRYVLQNTGDNTHPLSKMFCDLFMSVYEVCHKLPSTIAQVSLYLAYFITEQQLPRKVYPLMGITEAELKEECKDFIQHIFTFCTTPKETTLHRKYLRTHINPRLSDSQLDLLKELAA
jgi:hypothetical protein